MLTPATPEFESHLRALLPGSAFREATEAYTREPRGRWRGQGIVIAPGTTEEVAAVVRACAAARVGIVPFGGGTGLVGGQLAPDGPAPVILSLERMAEIRETSALDNTMVVEAGAILAAIRAEAARCGRLFPLSLASEGSARIGGLLATNAGGISTIRYGNARALCLGVEVVWPDGSVWNGLTRLRKDNAGYDLRDLVIGSEGTLGIITAAALRLTPRPGAVGAAIFAVPSPDAALDLLALAGDRLGDGIAAIELIGGQGPMFLAEVGPEVRQPFAAAPDWMVLIEVGLPAGAGADAALESLFEEAAGAELVTDGVIARSEAQRASFWTLRESIPEANRRIGSISSHDISVPLAALPDFIRKGGEVIAGIGDFRINCFGHLGDGNLHYNVFPAKGRSREDHEGDRERIKRAVHDLVHAMGGSVAAEHGIGRLKVDDLERYADPAKLAQMRVIKTAIDPSGIMNPGAVLRAR